MKDDHGIKSYVKCDFCSKVVYNSHCHLGYEFIYVTDGSITITIEGTEYELKSGFSIMIKPQKYHVVSGNNSIYGRLVVEFPENFIPSEIAEEFDAAVERNPVLPPETKTMNDKLTEYVKADNPKFYPLVHSLITQIAYYYAFENSADTPTNLVTDKIIESVVAYIEENLDRELSLAELSSALFISTSSLSHIFKEKMNISVKQYVLQKKMFYASGLLKEGIGANEAALRCGYSNYSSFYKVYVRIIGAPPSKRN